MFSFLEKAKKQATGAVKLGTKVARKELNFVKNTAEDAVDVGKAVVKDPAGVAKGVGESAIAGERTTANVLARLLPGGQNDIKAENEAIDQTNKNRQQITDLRESGKISDDHASKLIKALQGELGSNAESIKETQKSIPSQGQAAAGVASTAADILTAGSYSGLKAAKGVETAARIGGNATAGGLNAAAAGDDSGSVAGNVVAGALFPEALKGAVTGVKQAPKVAKAIDEKASDVAAKHPAVLALNDHLRELNKQRESLTSRGASEVAIKANTMAYRSTLKAREDTIKGIKEGGFIGKNDNPADIQTELMDALAPTQKANDTLTEIPKSKFETVNDIFKELDRPKEGSQGIILDKPDIQRVLDTFASHDDPINSKFRGKVYGKFANARDVILGHANGNTVVAELDRKGVPTGRIRSHATPLQQNNIVGDFGKVSSVDDTVGQSKYRLPEKQSSDAFVEALAPKNKELDDLEAAGGALTVKDNNTTALAKPGFEVPKSSAQVANETLPETTRLQPEVVDLLDKTGKATAPASKAPVLEGARDPQSVLSRYMGKEGADIGYEASRGAKRRSDLQEAANPLIDEAEKKLKKAAKTKAGQADVESRINKALEDRTNADAYLNTPAEKEAYEATKAFYDHYQGHLEKAGKGTLENYSPRVARQDAANASEGLDYTVTQAFSKNTDAPFLKERTKAEPDQELLEKPVSTMRNYSSSVSKQLAYEDMMSKLPEKLKNINPVHLTDSATKQRGKAYLQKYLGDLLQPDIPTSGKGLGKVIGEQTQNKLINNTYKSALLFSPKFGITNRTQGYATRSQVSSQARSLARKMDKKDLESLRADLTTGDNPISGEASTNAGNIGGSKTRTDKIQAKVSGERKNVNHAFDAGVAQHLVDSPIYKAAIKDGKKPKEAAKLALADPDTKDLAIRAGNTVTNTTQFGGNIANKPGWLRETGTVLGLSKKWYQQYQRFPLGMIQLMGNITNPKNARALDIMRRGDPKQTQLVDYLKAAQTLQNALPDAKKAIQAGETTVTKQQYKQSKKLLEKSVRVLDKEIKNNSQIRAGKTAKNVAKMWAAASTIQFLFDAAIGNGQDKTEGEKVTRAVQYGSPVSIPTKDKNPLTIPLPSSPIDKYGINARKLLNFVPVVGPLANRGRELKGFVEALTGDGQ